MISVADQLQQIEFALFQLIEGMETVTFSNEKQTQTLGTVVKAFNLIKVARKEWQE